MGKYLILQWKRALRRLLWVFLAAVILFGALGYAAAGFLSAEEESQVRGRFQVGMVGTEENAYLNAGLAALQSFDSSRFLIEVVKLEEPQAAELLEKGKLAAYVVVPPDFVENAMHGELAELKYVTTVGAADMNSMFKNEITRVINTLLTESQKGSFGAGMAAEDHGLPSDKIINTMSIRYVSFVLARSKLYALEELSASGVPGMDQQLVSGFCIVFLMLMCLPFAPQFVRSDLSLERMLSSGTVSAYKQVLCDAAVLFGSLVTVLASACLLLFLTGAEEYLPAGGMGYLKLLPPAAMTAGFALLMFELTGDLISGIFLEFLTSFAMCFLSGCLYPGTFFPESIQNLGALLPAGLAKNQFLSSITGRQDPGAAAALMVCTAVFLAACICIRHLRVAKVRG